MGPIRNPLWEQKRTEGTLSYLYEVELGVITNLLTRRAQRVQ